MRLLRHSAVLARRSLIGTWRTPEALVDVTIQPIIFLLLFTYVFGGAISGGSQHDYLQFLLPGILAQTIAMAGVSIGVNLNTDIHKGVFDRFRSLPIARAAPLTGAVLAVHVLLACLLAVAFALCLCWTSVFIGMRARTPGAVQGLMVLIVLPLSFGSSAFVSPDSMPGWLQAFAEANPLSQLVGAERALLLGEPMGAHLWWTLAWMAGLLAVFVPLALAAYRKRV